MTERKQALIALRDKVRDGVNYETMGHTLMCQKAFPKPDDFDGSREAYRNSAAQQAILAWRNGSIDAALALCEAVLPGWDWDVSSWGGTDDRASAKLQIKGDPEDKEWQWGVDKIPARALLLAILEVLISEEE